MIFPCVLTLLTFLRLLSLSQPSHVQVAKQHIRTEVRSALGQHAPTSAETSEHYYNRHPHPHSAGVHYYNGQRVQRLPHHRRWSDRRRSIDHYQHHHYHRRHHPKHHHSHHHHHRQNAHHQFSGWSTWSPCGGVDCVKRRERYCRQKRKCGHTKHVEERKCWSCHQASTSSVTPHEVTPSSSHTSPAIIINAAAAAASGQQTVHDVIAVTTTTSAPLMEPPKVVHHVPEYQPPSEIVHPPYAPPFGHEHIREHSHEDEDYGESDFYVLKSHRKARRPRKPKHFEPNDSLEDDDFVDYNPSLRSQNHKQRGAVHQRNLGGSFDDTGLDGDIFQYEDFDFEPEPNSESYEQHDYDDIRNTSHLWQQIAKERATPEALVPRHRRLYSKWSRWTKCSPKCTTRRYKKCRIREHCGREVLREIAYCYTEGSFCQQWLQAQVQKTPPMELRPVTATRRMHDDSAAITNNAIVNDYIMNGKGYRGPEYTPQKLKCGIAPIRSNKRNMYNMLKIIGGKASRKGEWPWQVAIFNRFKEAFCGGTLIAPQWVLTAAHCVRKVLYVRIGEHNLDYDDGTEVQLRVLKTFKHPNFDKKTVDSDVALLRLPKPVNATTWIGYSCLPRPYQPLPKNVDCTVIGWGKRRNRDIAGTSVLHQAEVPIIPMDNCRSVYQDYTITKNMFCAGHKRGRIDTCAGDSGGPLLCRDTTKPNHPWTIFGITSFGDGCAKRNKFGIYAKVPNYVDWAWSVINCNGNCKLQRNYAGEQ